MLGWMLKRGEHAQEADAEDTAQLDQPDTPAPLFAARAFKSALFGTPAPPGDESRSKRQDKKAGRKTSAKPERGSGTPTRPPGILLTPGTGTTRRKRVSFGNHVAETAKPESPKKPQKESAKASKSSGAGPPANDSDGEWEEEEDDDYCTHDITVDLNEPHSQSGRYWKEEFEKYHEEAKAEMEKLLKYKQLAKSYARQKDAEAIQLAERLRDEQQKVIDMEKRIAENASQIVSKHRHPSDADPSESLSKLTKQTALAAQYRHRVQELEDELDQLVRQKDGSTEGRGRRRRHVAASPTTQKTLVETQRELRRARTQLRELDSLREEVLTLRAQVKVAEAQASKHERADVGSSGEGRVRTLKADLDQSREESRRKTEEIRQLKSDFEAFRKESETHEADTKAVLERAHTKISDLKREVKTLKSAGPDQSRPSSWRPQSDAGQESGSVTQPKGIAAPALPTMSGAAVRMGEAEDHGEVDLLHGRFARVGGPDTNRSISRNSNKTGGSILGNSSKSSVLPPERRAAALARIEKRMAEKKRAPRSGGYNKENQRP
ncbi:spindle pole body formation-associated protein [Hirsutella rhossiliensis]|uniref:Spindle pole body formation-associated protein n=1 Tax=Hirsutella rhossiliensis TaxID=111463 RepID=A0A9P8SLL3_9HYPO|nr:spindle pole body formation-associated protein [Hirsutella rhossiliensis]KAH0965271.1 spindle pole body formation-associated protein [Hirsutella rhossiliensis]